MKKWWMLKNHKRVGVIINQSKIMNLGKINSQAVKSVKKVDPAQSLSIESMKKVMGGGSYGAHCCVAKNLN